MTTVKIEPRRFARKPFFVEAVQVTAENIDALAEWCSGEVQTTLVREKGFAEPFIKVRVLRPANERQTMAFIDDWVLYAGVGYKVYTDRPFHSSFEETERVSPVANEEEEKEGTEVEGKEVTEVKKEVQKLFLELGERLISMAMAS